jgi:hypothetical protein
VCGDESASWTKRTLVETILLDIRQLCGEEPPVYNWKLVNRAVQEVVVDEDISTSLGRAYVI